MAIQLKSLKVFSDVVRLGSFSKAAELNGVSQPSASQMVHQLEERLGVQLIDRSKRPFVVTPEGELYYDGCRDVVQRYDDLERAVREAHDARAGRLRVAAIYSVGLGQMHRVVEAFRAESPGADLHVDYMHPDQVRAAVLAGEVDLGVTSYAETDKQFVATHWRDEPFAVAASPEHPLASLHAVAAETLADHPLVMPQAGLRVRDEVDRWLAAQRVRTEVALEFDNLESVKRAIEVGEGVGLLPAPTFAAEIASGALVRVDLLDADRQPAEFVRPLGVLRRRGDELSRLGERFVNLLRSNTEPAPRPRAPSPAA